MPRFEFSFTVNAPLTAVSDFHHDTSVLKKLTPPPIFAQIHHFDPLADGAVAAFTLWFGPIPVRWRAVHSDVSVNGFTDTQAAGPLKSWQHTHRFTAVSPTITRVDETIVYEYPNGGPWAIFTRLFFNKPALTGLFTARKLLTRWHLRQRAAKGG